MTLLTSQTSPRDIQADAIVIGVVQAPGGPQPAPGSGDVDQALDGGLATTLSVLGATGRAEEITKIATAGRLTAPLIVAVGIGPVQDGAPRTARRCAGRPAPRSARWPARKPRQVALALPASDDAEAEAVGLGALLGGYVFSRYRANGHQPTTELTILGGASDAAVRRARTARRRGHAGARPGQHRPVAPVPGHLRGRGRADRGRGRARHRGAGRAARSPTAATAASSASGRARSTRRGWSGWRTPRPARPRPWCFAGKGITFDSGGLSLKPAKAMETMKSDMGGAAAVLAALQAICQRSARRSTWSVTCRSPRTCRAAPRNAPPMCITIYGGTTVEVLNTDAEGRLVLADALARSGADSPDLLVDVATLTGAQTRRAGPADQRRDGQRRRGPRRRGGRGRRAGEAAWPMPLPDELRKGLDSPVADLANVTAERHGGMLVAGLFLKEFVPPGVRWAHLDIAGPAFHEGRAVRVYAERRDRRRRHGRWSRSRWTSRTDGCRQDGRTAGAAAAGPGRRNGKGAHGGGQAAATTSSFSAAAAAATPARCARPSSASASRSSRRARSAAPACTAAASRPRRCCTPPRSPTRPGRARNFGVRATLRRHRHGGGQRLQGQGGDPALEGPAGLIASRNIDVIDGDGPPGVADRGPGRRHRLSRARTWCWPPARRPAACPG